MSQAKGGVGATIAQSVQQSFAQSVSWKRVTDSDDDTTTDPDDPTDDQSSGGGNNNGPSTEG